MSLPIAAPLTIEVVTGHGGNPVEGASVRISTWDNVTASQLGIVDGVTDRAGLLVLTPPVGEILVTAYTSDRRYGQYNGLHSGVGGEQRIRLELDELAEVRGIVRDEEGRTLSDVRVTCDMTADVDGAFALSDEGGQFLFKHLPQEAGYALTFKLDGYGSEHVILVIDPALGWRYLDQTVWSVSPAFVEVTLRPQKRILGTVTRENGDAVVEARVRAIGWIPTLAVVRFRDSTEVRADEKGQFVIEGLRSDIAHVILCEEPREGVAVRIAPAGEIVEELGSVVVRSYSKVAGRIVDRFGRPIGGALIELRAPNPRLEGAADDDDSVSDLVPGYQITSQSDRDGRFSLRGPPSAGGEVFVRLGRREIARAVDVDLSHGDAQLGDLHAEPTVEFVGGILFNGTGIPLASARLEVMSSNSRLLAKSETDAQGSFEFAVIPDVYDSVTLMHRSRDGLLTGRWVRSLSMFPVELQLTE